jgi:type III restriction enzyme
MSKKKIKKTLTPIFQEYVEGISISYNKDLISPFFSRKKKLFEYQLNALKNGLKGLYLFYKTFQANKRAFAQTVYGNYANELSPKVKNKELFDLLSEFYNLKGQTLPFEEISNRMSFWMATGSGKTIVIVKLIEILFNLMEEGLIPAKPVLFLTAREDLIRAFLNHLDEYNKSAIGKQISPLNLKDYEREKVQGNLFKKIFYYRSDLISDEAGDKKLDFKTLLDTDTEGNLLGNWYIILDEAHKGDKEESKRQHLINILSKDGFLFNFSATFTEPIDIVTTIFNFNLNEFISKGYGKQIYLFQSEVKGFEKKKQLREFSSEEKKKIVLKTLILLTGLKKAKKQLSDLYHEPMAIYLINRVNTEDADLKLLFEELLNFAVSIEERLFEIAKKELIEELTGSSYLIGNGKIDFAEDFLKSLNPNDIYKEVYNASGSGTLEYEYYKENDEEVALKHTAAEKPFALIKIGSVKKIQKSFLWKYQENELFENPKYFERLNHPDSPINILIGSKAFYEGWDSTRPNVITLINLGKQSEARKFVLQAIGRGLRIEPVKNYRQRLQYILTQIKDGEFELINKIKDKVNSPAVKALETLFIFATNRNAIKTIFEELTDIKRTESYKIVSLYENSQMKNKILLIPKYTDNRKEIYKLKKPPKFRLSKRNYKLLETYLKKVSIERFIFDWNSSPEEFKVLKRILNKPDIYLKIDESNHYTSLKSVITALIGYIRTKVSDLDKREPFIPLPEGAISHFKELKVKEEYADAFKRLITEVINAKPLKDSEKAEKALEYITRKNITFKEAIALIEKESSLKREFLNFIFVEKHPNSYYIPIIYSKKGLGLKATEVLKPLINIDSEIEFLDVLKRKKIYLDEITDYWFFSKLNEHKDKTIYIPYIDRYGKEAKFIPDFIFWFKPKNSDRYLIYFVDPKGFEHTDYERKIDGYERIFTTNGIPKVFSYGNLKVEVRLKLFNISSDKVSKKYAPYWVDEKTLFEDLVNYPAS